MPGAHARPSPEQRMSRSLAEAFYTSGEKPGETYLNATWLSGCGQVQIETTLQHHMYQQFAGAGGGDGVLLRHRLSSATLSH